LKKIAAILLLLLLAFNWYGYRIVISILQNHADQKLEARIDNSDYDESQLIEIRVAMNLPYQERFTDFERHYGEIEIDGKTYTYVKRKVEGDMVILKCIANKTKQQLKTIDNDLTKANNGIDTEHPGKQQPSSFAKSFWSEYDGQNVFNIQNKYITLNNNYASGYLFYVPEINHNTPHQPPEC
jgi:hypothetical protein